MQKDLSKTEAFNYELPKALIAQNPAEQRDSSRLLVVDRDGGGLEHKSFRDLGDYLQPGDLLVMNDTRVLPARVMGVKKNGGANIELFFLRPATNANNTWTALVKPGRKLPKSTLVTVGGELELTIGARLEDGLRLVAFPDGCDVSAALHRFGETPLPHYITSSTVAPERYQTVYARAEKENSVAAPTAGLHFTEKMLSELGRLGIEQTYITLQVGLGTFRPVKSDEVAQHVMHSEFCEITAEAAQKINEAKKRGGRVIAVGTTVVRTIEATAALYGWIKPGALDTSLFITPGFRFMVVDALITNFHLPKSTLLMLVTAFGGYDIIMDAYREAVREEYRFFSFGDSMLIR